MTAEWVVTSRSCDCHAVSKTLRTIVGDIGLKTAANAKREGVKLQVETLLVLDDDLTYFKQCT